MSGIITYKDPSDLDDCESSEVGFFKTDAGEGMCGGRNWPAKTGDRGNLTCRNLGPDPRIVDLGGLTPDKKNDVKALFLRDLCSCTMAMDRDGKETGCETVATDTSGSCLCRVDSLDSNDIGPGIVPIKVPTQTGKTCYETCVDSKAILAEVEQQKKEVDGESKIRGVKKWIRFGGGKESTVTYDNITQVKYGDDKPSVKSEKNLLISFLIIGVVIVLYILYKKRHQIIALLASKSRVT